MHPIKRYRYEKGWTQAYIAERLLVHRNAVIEWEKGTVPRRRMVARVAKLFGVPRGQLETELIEYKVNTEV